MKLVAIGILACVFSACLPAADVPAAGEPVELAEFGTLKTWPGGEEGEAISRKSGAPRQPNIGIEWDEPREFSEVRLAVRAPIPAKDVHLEYWVSAWPAVNGGGWTLTDTPWKGSWREIHVQPENKNGLWRLRFDPLILEENPNAKNQPGYAPRFRRALKMRLRFTSAQPPELTRLEVLGLSRWNTRDILVENGCGGKPATTVSATAYNGRILRSETSGHTTKMTLLYLEHAPGSSDATIVTLKSRDLSFGVSVDDLLRHKGIYVQDAGVFVGDGASGETFDSYVAAGRLRPGFDIISQVIGHDEQSLERAMGDIPALSMTGRSGRDSVRYIPIGMFANREKYGVTYNGHLFVSKHGSKLFQEETKRMLWEGDEISYKIGAGVKPDFREREHSARQHVVDGYQPIVQTDWAKDGLEFREEAFATLVDTPLDFWKIRGDEASAALVTLAVRNPSSAAQHATVWLDVTPHEKLELQGDRLLAGERLRALARSATGKFVIAPMPLESGKTSPALRWEAELGPGESVDLRLAFTFRTLTSDSEMSRLAALDYNAERIRVMRFWSAATDQGMRLHVPDEILNRFYRSVLQHILLSVYRDVPTGLYMDPCGTYDYNIFANETDMQVRLLDMRGLHEMAAKFVEPLVALQGSKPFPGRFRDTSAILHGVRIDAEHDYTHSGYNLNHGWTLWTLAEHYLFTRDTDWLRSRLPKIQKAAEWIVSERKATMRTDQNGEKVWEYGLLPAGQLEDNEEWQYWFAVNAYAYRGLHAAAEALSDLGDAAEGALLRREAESYRQDLRTAIFRSMAASPVAPLHDGTWVPAIGTRTHAHGRDVGWIRNILYGPQVLLDCEVLSPSEPAAAWILKDLEDNLFMSGESFSVAEQDWFSRGGITLQPNLVNTAVTYLARDEVPQALRAFYNAFAVGYYPDINAFTEWEPSFGRSGGPFFKTSDESGSLAWLRQMLIRESEGKLYLASGTSRRWFRDGEFIEVQGAATFYGPVDFRIDSHAAEGFDEATVRIPEKFRGTAVMLRLRHPEGKAISRVELDGAPWARFEANKGWIEIPVTAGVKRVRAYF